MSNAIETNSARLCHIIKRENFDGYGFNLHAEKGKPGQYIGKVDDNSPAEAAGLKQGDRIIEVNAVNIGNETHKQVVQRIKAIACEVRLLVVDPNVVPVSNNNQVLDSDSFNDATNSSPLNIDQINANDVNDGVITSVNGKNGETTPTAHSPTLIQSSSLPPASETSSIGNYCYCAHIIIIGNANIYNSNHSIIRNSHWEVSRREP